MIDLEADRDMLCQRMWATNNGFLEAYPFPQEFVLLNWFRAENPHLALLKPFISLPTNPAAGLGTWTGLGCGWGCEMVLINQL